MYKIRCKSKIKNALYEEKQTEFYLKYKDATNISNLKFHDLRHTVATRLLKENVPVPVVRDLLAHSDIKTTMIYNQTDSLDMMHAIQVLDSYN